MNMVACFLFFSYGNCFDIYNGKRFFKILYWKVAFENSLIFIMESGVSIYAHNH